MTGGWASTWLYPAKGLRLTMESSDKKGPFTVKFVTIEGTNPTKTKLGIGIGATRAAVEKAYGTRVQAEASDAGQVYTADSNDGSATTFTIKGGKVTSITHGDNMIGGGD